jgi:hypothetical protein
MRQGSDPFVDVIHEARVIHDEDFRISYIHAVWKRPDREAAGAKNAAIEACKKRLEELLMELWVALDVRDVRSVLPEEWSPYHKRYFGGDWYGFYPAEVLKNIDIAPVAKLYPQKGMPGRPPTDLLFLCETLYYAKYWPKRPIIKELALQSFA